MSAPDVAFSPGTAGAYEARRSNKAARTNVMADGAIWKERLAVCETVTNEGNPKLTVRSYYRNQDTLERVWDEPPSGASEIIFASSEQRKKADLKKQQMQLTLDEIPPDSKKYSSAPLSTNPNNSRGKKAAPAASKGLFGRFKKTKQPITLRDDAKDLNLQRAIALSVAEANGKVDIGTDPVILYDTEEMPPPSEAEDLALAKALSLSTGKLQPSGLSEDELLQKALEESRLDSMRVPSFDPYAPGNQTTTASSRASSSARGQTSSVQPPRKMESNEDKKKPARTVKRRVLGGRKAMANKAGMV